MDGIFKKIHKVLTRHDPISLIAQGAPDDEYDLEIPMIIEYLNSSPDQDLLADFMYSLYKKQFSEDFDVGPKETYIEIAKKILSQER